MMNTRYETDFYGWTQEQARLLRSGQLSELDTQNLLEEIEAMGRSERRELESRLEVLILHLLKWRYQDTYRGKSWLLTIKEQRRRLADCLDDNPSLRNRLDDILNKGYQYARLSAAKETGYNESVFPSTCPWTFEQIMNTDFFPD